MVDFIMGLSNRALSIRAIFIRALFYYSITT